MDTLKKLSAIFLFIISVSLIFTACGEDSEERSNFEQEREELVSDLESLKDDLDDQIEDLSSRIERAGEESDEGLNAALNKLRDDRSDLERAIDNVKNATEDGWESVKSETENLYDRVSSTLNDWADEIRENFDNN